MFRAIATTLLICGCALSGGCTYAAVEAMDRVDEAVSKFAQSDCELIRLVHGEAVCQEAVAPEQQEIYCYRRLGGVDCYAARDPIDKPILPPAIDQKAARLGS